MRKKGKVISFGIVLVLLASLVSGCVTTVPSVDFNVTLGDEQNIFLYYSDGSQSTLSNQTKSPDNGGVTVANPSGKTIVGAYVHENGISWVPDYSYSSTSSVDVGSVNSNKPTEAADYAVLQHVETVAEGTSVTFAVYESGGDLLVNGRTSVFAKSAAENQFYNNDLRDQSLSDYVNEGFASYTENGLVKFIINTSDVSAISTLPLKLYSGTELIYDSTWNETLRTLELSNATLTPAFNPSVTSYTAEVPYEAESLTVTASVYDDRVAGLEVGGNSTVSGQASQVLALQAGSNPIEVRVTPFNENSLTYTVNVTRAAAATNANLSTLTLSSGTLSPAFTAEQTSYTAQVPNSVSTVTLTPTVEESHATVTVQGSVVGSGQASDAIRLNVGDNTVTVIGTAQDATTTKPITVTITRAAAPVDTDNDNDSDVNTSAPLPNAVASTDGKLTLAPGQKGEVSLGQAVKIVIPADASGKPLILTIEEVKDTSSLLTNDEVLASQVYEILKDFTENFEQPITLTFAFDPSTVKSGQRAAVFYYDEAEKSWVEIEGSTVNGSDISVEVNHFTKFAVLVVEAKEDKPEVSVHLSDIAGHWAQLSIEQAVGSGIARGYPDGTFRPEASVTRAEFTVMLMQTIQPDHTGTTLNFSDAGAIDTWTESAVSWAGEAGIVNGYEDGTFRPQAMITRTELAAMLAAAIGQTAVSDGATGFADHEAIPSWARGAIAQLAELGIVEGDMLNHFRPDGTATRAEAVSVLLRLKALSN
ncbi:S-layer homology domain-containing protein [Paenibacillus sp. TRM 82003]|nr:S-layer homology domain-containing protein [Paenibacillus sp. TRM 82003]